MNLLVIAVEYEDKPHTYPADQIQLKIFGEEGSVADYYHDVSYKSVTIKKARKKNGTIDDGLIGWLKLSGKHPNTGYNTDKRNQKIAKNAIMAADEYIDFDIYDSNNDGIIEPTELSIIVIVAGYEASFSGSLTPSIWGHQGCMANVGYPVVDGKTIERYAELGEIHKDHLATMGIMAHELGHLMFSLPDLYDTTPYKTVDSFGIGAFCLMGYGAWGAAEGKLRGSSPTYLCAWSTESLNWGIVNPIKSAQTVSFPSVRDNKSSIFRIDTQDKDQYFLIENRQFSGYDIGFQGLAGTSGHGGLVMYHIDKLKTGLWPEQNTVNADVNDKGVDIEEANEGSKGSMLDNMKSSVDTGMFYFQENSNVSFTDKTVPNSKLKNGKSTNISVTSISSPTLPSS